MDKVAKYQNILVKFLTEYAEKGQIANMPEVETRVIADREHNSFQVLHIGWHGAQYIFSPILHFDIKEGKVWFQCNNTENDVVDELMAMGLPKDDIVLGFQPTYARPYSGFAVA